MSKIHLIIKKEYTERVMKKSFILLTFLTPVAFVAIMLLPSIIMQMQDQTEKHIVVIDRTGLYRDALPSNDTYTFDFTDAPAEQVREQGQGRQVLHRTALHHRQPGGDPPGATLYSGAAGERGPEGIRGTPPGQARGGTEDRCLPHPRPATNHRRLEGRPRHRHHQMGRRRGEQEASAEMALVIGMVSAMMIYIFIIMYGTQVMNGVMQEKSNRIVEVIVSSGAPVRPDDGQKSWASLWLDSRSSSCGWCSPWCWQARAACC